MTREQFELSDFLYQLPDSQIRQQRSEDTLGNRLLVRERSGELRHLEIRDLVDEIPANTLIVANDSKVIPSRLLGHLPTGGKVEVFLLEPDGESTWTAIGKPMKKLKVGCQLDFANGLTSEVIEILECRKRFKIAFNKDSESFLAWIREFGYIPLPPYLTRPNCLTAKLSPDLDRYQTAYARTEGSVAAPTAGLHLSASLIKKLESKGIEFAYVTLHVGAGTFLPVVAKNIQEHVMHSERYLISSDTNAKIESALLANKNIIFVGTTSLRCVEDFFLSDRRSKRPDSWQRTNLFIYPTSRQSRYKPQIGNALMTNFHQPGSSLLMLVSALIGVEETRTVYETALKQGYQFLSYGDSSLLWFR